MTTIGERLRKARKLRGLNQIELATKAQIKQPSLSDIETGETKIPDGLTTVNLCEALRIRPAWLIKNKLPMEPVENPLPAEAYEVAQSWLRLAPGLREKLAETIREAAVQADKFGPPIDDPKVERAYGTPRKEPLLRMSRTSVRKKGRLSGKS
jgi:transcriptional regulator with XRE-family HTH domain